MRALLPTRDEPGLAAPDRELLDSAVPVAGEVPAARALTTVTSLVDLAAAGGACVTAYRDPVVPSTNV